MTSRRPLVDPQLADAATLFTSLDHQSVFQFVIRTLSVTAGETALALGLELKRTEEILECLVRKGLIKRQDSQEGQGELVLYSPTLQGARMARTLQS